MDRKQQVKNILRQMEDELEMILEAPELLDLSSEECIGLAFEVIMESQEVKPTMIKPVEIDRNQVLFMIDDEEAIPLREGGLDDDEDDIL